MNDLIPEWRYVRGFVTTNRYHRVYRDDILGVQLEVLTKRRSGMPVGYGKSYFFIDKDDREFKSKKAMLKALREKSEAQET